MGSDPTYDRIVEARRALSIPGYSTLSEVGLDGPWTTPYHIASRSPDGPILLTYNYLDAPSAIVHRSELLDRGYLASMPFNRVLDLALATAGLRRSDIYVTHVFHLLPATRSGPVPARLLDLSFDAVARQELIGRQVIALGRAAERTCKRHGIQHLAVPHLSARGENYGTRASMLADALIELTYPRPR